MEQDDQIFININPDKEPVEFLLTTQPLAMIRGGFTTKKDIKQAVEAGSSYVVDEYIHGVELTDLGLFVTLDVRIDSFLKIIDNVEKHIL